MKSRMLSSITAIDAPRSNQAAGPPIKFAFRNEAPRILEQFWCCAARKASMISLSL
jgi:hypothetical protein